MSATDIEAWFAWQWAVLDRKQVDIARDCGVTPTVVCNGLVSFLWKYDEITDRVYNANRKQALLRALEKFIADGGILHPHSDHNEMAVYWQAHREHAFWLRQQGLTFKQIAERTGRSSTRCSQMVHREGRRLTKAVRNAKWRWVHDSPVSCP